MVPALLLALLMFLCSPAWAKEEPWINFTTPGGDVSVSTPVPLIDKTDKTKFGGLETFIARAKDGNIFLVTTIPNAYKQTPQEGFESYKTGIKVRDEKAGFSNIESMKGAGWSGQKAVCTTSKGTKQATLWTMDDAHLQFVTLGTTYPLTDKNAIRFFKSLKIDPEKTRARVASWKTAEAAMVAKDASWKTFTVPKGDLSVSVPAQMQSTSDPAKSFQVETYGTIKKEDILRMGTAYSITITPNLGNLSFDAFLKQAKDAFAEKKYKPITKADVVVRGPGWKGVQLTYEGFGTRSSYQIVADEGKKIFAVVTVLAMLDDPRAQRYFKSLKIDTGKARKRHDDALAALRKPTKNKSGK